jgi:hypothetical protein
MAVRMRVLGFRSSLDEVPVLVELTLRQSVCPRRNVSFHKKWYLTSANGVIRDEVHTKNPTSKALQKQISTRELHIN